MSYYVIPKRFQLAIDSGTFASVVFQAPAQIDLTGKTITMHIRKNVDAAKEVLELSTANSLITVNDQQFTITFLAANTADLQGAFVADIKVNTTGQQDFVIIGKGDITFNKTVTR